VKVVVVGAGVGGVASALALVRAGHEVRVLEQAEQLRTGGYGLVLWSNGTGILRELGIEVDALGHRLDRVSIHDENGTAVVWADLAEIAQQIGSDNVVVTRSGLVARMAESLPAGTFAFGAHVTGIEQHGDRVSVSLSDGSVEEGDLLVGADGHRSLVRRLMVDDRSASFTGWATWHGTTSLPIELTSGHKVQTLTGDGGCCVMHPLGQGRLYWAFETPWTDGDVAPPGAVNGHTSRTRANGSTPSAVANLRDRFGHWASPVPELLDAITDEDIGVFPHILHRVPRRWGRGPVTLVGDAAHAVPPRSGMGANQALEDAWALPRALAGPGSLSDRLRTYERLRRRRLRMLWVYAALTGRMTGKQPGFLRRNEGGVSATGFQHWQIRTFSTYLNSLDQRPSR
jgi:FAD-dependent urate hydroxylase